MDIGARATELLASTNALVEELKREASSPSLIGREQDRYPSNLASAGLRIHRGGRYSHCENVDGNVDASSFSDVGKR
ncbi:hypothetical protein CBM2634_U180010 [Cupriavidus taiwanensis]|uniref:Uncharacterized protein n=1 Tax=Cupriavidus taiwanensis TaxID=164546 RepID=A0A375JBL4_9BURK|nr:hypothetical protein CBM2634_U180010 [Cupriavidus taiwanensis]